MKLYKSKGFTLVEIICAVAIFAIAAVIMINGLLLIWKINTRTAGVVNTTSAMNTGIDALTPPTITPANFTITINASPAPTTFTVSGNYQTVTPPSGGDITSPRTRFNYVK